MTAPRDHGKSVDLIAAVVDREAMLHFEVFVVSLKSVGIVAVEIGTLMDLYF